MRRFISHFCVGKFIALIFFPNTVGAPMNLFNQMDISYLVILHQVHADLCPLFKKSK